MTWLLPTPLLLLATIAALVPLAALLRRPVSLLSLIAETFTVTFVFIAAFWLGWPLRFIRSRTASGRRPS